MEMELSMGIVSGLKSLGQDISDAVRREIRYYRLTPYTATLFLTYRCDSRCVTCTMWKRSSTVKLEDELGLQEWKGVIDELEAIGVTNVEIFGGNVLLRKDVLIPLLEYLRKKDFIVHLPTNQIGLDEDTARAMAECCTMVYISTDGVGEVHDKVRGLNGAFKRVSDSVVMIKKYRRNGLPQIVCNTTVSKYNFHVLENIAEEAVSKGFDQIHFEYVGEFSKELIQDSKIDGLVPEPYYVKQEESSLLGRKEAALLKSRVREIKRRFWKDIYVYTTNIEMLSERDFCEGTAPNRKCYVTRGEVTIDPYGNILACLFISNYILGNVKTERISTIIKNDRHRRFMKIRDSGKIKLCNHCVLGVQRNPTFLDKLRRIYISRIKPL